jgi:predicted amidohydrolase YtcJ
VYLRDEIFAPEGHTFRDLILAGRPQPRSRPGLRSHRDPAASGTPCVSGAPCGGTLDHVLDLLIRDARIRTVDPARPTATAVGIWNGAIVGLDEQVLGLPTRSTLSADGAVIVPGFHDAHCHTTSYGLGLVLLDLTDVQGPAAALDAVAAYAAGLGATDWVIGTGYGAGMPLGEHLTRDELDRAGDGRPVWLTHFSGHQCVVSGAVLAAVGIGAGTTTERGRIGTDAAGRPNGLLEEAVMDLVKDYVGPSSAEQLARAIDKATSQYAAEGITSFTDAGIGCPGLDHSPVEVAAYQLARRSGWLRARAQLMVHNEMMHELTAHPEDAIARGLDFGMHTGFGDDWLGLGAMKIWVDGLGVEGADGKPDFDNDPALLRRDIIAAHRAGWQVAAHAMGDHAVDLVLDALAEARSAGPAPVQVQQPRHRIEHGGLIRPDQLSRLADAAMTVVTQPIIVSEFGDLFAEVVAADRLAEVFRVRSLIEAGIPVAGSSDRPVAPGSSLRGMQAMVQRQSAAGVVHGPQERVTAAQALAAYTVGGARAARAEHHRGLIARDQAADLVLLSDDPLTVPDEKLAAIDVLGTIVGGAASYDQAGLLAEVPPMAPARVSER